ncbi:hypothetical protein ABZZ04_23680 [Streptomyces sp. NPDC006435]
MLEAQSGGGTAARRARSRAGALSWTISVHSSQAVRVRQMVPDSQSA